MTHKEILDELRQPVKDLREHIPAVFEGYGALSGAVFVDGALDAKTKELIALADRRDQAVRRLHAHPTPAARPDRAQPPRRSPTRSASPSS